MGHPRPRFLVRHESWAQTESGHEKNQTILAIEEALQVSREAQSARKCKLEAYLLTAEPLPSVAEHCSLSQATVNAYHQLFYDVRSHLHAKDWIALHAIGSGLWTGFGGAALGDLWKGFAYAAGPRLLEVVVASTLNQPMPDWVQTCASTNPKHQEARLRLSCKLLIHGLTTQSDALMSDLVKISQEAFDVEHGTRRKRKRSGGMLAAMEGFLETLGRRKGPSSRQESSVPTQPRNDGNPSRKKPARKPTSGVLLHR